MDMTGPPDVRQLVLSAARRTALGHDIDDPGIAELADEAQRIADDLFARLHPPPPPELVVHPLHPKAGYGLGGVVEIH
jgi:hypothetical protein